MTRISYKRHRFPPTVLQHAVWLYFHFTLSLRDVEEMLAHRGVDVSYEGAVRLRANTRQVNSATGQPYLLSLGNSISRCGRTDQKISCTWLT